MDSLNLLSLLNRHGRNNILNGLIDIDQIILNVDVIPNTDENQRSSDKERSKKQAQVCAPLFLVRKLVRVKRPHDGGTGGLKTLVETDVVGGTTTGVGQSTHDPG